MSPHAITNLHFYCATHNRSVPTSPRAEHAHSGVLAGAISLRRSASALPSQAMLQQIAATSTNVSPQRPMRGALASTLQRMQSPSRQVRPSSVDTVGSQGARSEVSGESSPTLAPSSPSSSAAGHTTTVIRPSGSRVAHHSITFEFHRQGPQRPAQGVRPNPSMLGASTVAAAVSAVSADTARAQQSGPSITQGAGRPPLAPAPRPLERISSSPPISPRSDPQPPTLGPHPMLLSDALPPKADRNNTGAAAAAHAHSVADDARNHARYAAPRLQHGQDLRRAASTGAEGLMPRSLSIPGPIPRASSATDVLGAALPALHDLDDPDQGRQCGCACAW